MLLTSFNSFLYGQDTTYLEPKQQYFSKNGDSVLFAKTRKTKYPCVRYSEEKIRLSQNKYKIESCYYFDDKRFAGNYVEFFEIIDDTILITKKEKWIFKKINDSLFSVYQKDTNFVEKGFVSSLIPLIKNGAFNTYNKNGKCLFIEYFKNGKYLKIDCPQIEFIDSVYTQVDELPKFPEKYGNLKMYISQRLKYPEEALENSIQRRVFVQFVITLKGEVKNVNIIRGVDPLMDKEAFKVIANLPDFEPAILHGKKVNAYFTFPVNFKLE